MMARTALLVKNAMSGNIVNALVSLKLKQKRMISILFVQTANGVSKKRRSLKSLR